jgi:hypothetical protein
MPPFVRKASAFTLQEISGSPTEDRQGQRFATVRAAFGLRLFRPLRHSCVTIQE